MGHHLTGWRPSDPSSGRTLLSDDIKKILVLRRATPRAGQGPAPTGPFDLVFCRASPGYIFFSLFCAAHDSNPPDGSGGRIAISGWVDILKGPRVFFFFF